MTLSDAFAALDAHYARTLDRLARPDRLRAAPSADAWSEAQHLWHADAVARGSLGALRRMQRGGGETAPVHPKAAAVLENGVLPRGFKAPDALGTATGTFAHPRFGPLDAPAWVAFTALHCAHHDRLVDELGD